MDNYALTINDNENELPAYPGTEGIEVVDILERLHRMLGYDGQFTVKTVHRILIRIIPGFSQQEESLQDLLMREVLAGMGLILPVGTDKPSDLWALRIE